MTDRDNVGPLFETPADRVVGEAPPAARALLRKLLERPLERPTRLLEAVRVYLAKLEKLRSAREFLDIETARAVAGRCQALLIGLGQEPARSDHLLVQLAVRYFIEEEDAECDIDSPIGFDDDSSVLEAVVRELETGNAHSEIEREPK